MPVFVSNELAEAIRSGPKELNLCDNIFFRRRSLSNPPIFADFLQALRENNTIERLLWRPRFSNNLSPDQRLEAYQVIGQMRSLVDLDMAAPLTEASPIGIACQAPNLRSLKINTTMSLRYDATAQDGLVQALQGSQTLERFDCLFASHTTESLDPLIRALATCPNLTACAITTTHPVSGPALARLLAQPSLRDLQFGTVLPRDLSWDFPRVEACAWTDLAEPLASPSCRLRHLRLITACDSHELTPHAVNLASALRHNQHLQELRLESVAGFSDEACEALAGALKVHPALQHVGVAGDDWRGATFRLESARSYQAFRDVLRDKETGLTMTIGKPVDEAVCRDQRIHYRDMLVQMVLHQVGRHEVMRTHRREAWVRSMVRLNGLEVADPRHSWAIADDKDWELFKLECIAWMVRENPLVTKRVKERRKESLMFLMKEEYVQQALLKTHIAPPPENKAAKDLGMFFL